MKPACLIVLSASLTFAAAAAQAQFVKGNEAIRVDSKGTKQVETPPMPKDVLAKPCPAAQAGCAGGGWNMLETTEGLE